MEKPTPSQTDRPAKAAEKRERRAEKVISREKPTAAPQAAKPDALSQLKSEERAEFVDQLRARAAIPEHANNVHAMNDRQYQAQMDALIYSRVDERLRAYVPEREIVREPARLPVKEPARVAYDREGNSIARRRNGAADQFAIPPELREKDWDYQWIRVSTHGQEDVDNQVSMQENGWRSVPADRPGWKGRFMPHDYAGAIIKSGLMLVERPMILTEEARREDKNRLSNQTRQQREMFGLTLPDGFSAATPNARANTGIKVGKIEATPADLKPTHEIEF